MKQSPGRRRLAWLSRTSYCVLGVSWQWVLGLAVALVFLLAPSSMVAQKTAPKTDNDSAASLGGTVTAQDGSALVGAMVRLIRKAPTGAPATTETDENGHYEFLNLVPKMTDFCRGRRLQKK